MPFAMELASASFSGQSGDDYTALITINVYDATGWTANPPDPQLGSTYQPPAQLPATPYAIATVTVHGADSDAAAVAIAQQAAIAAIKQQQAQVALTSRTAKFQGKLLAVPGI
jgi:hypothetical protein